MSEGEPSDNSLILSNTEKIKLLSSLLKELSPYSHTSLPVDISYEPIRDNEPDATHVYTIPGSTLNRRTQNSNLVAKLTQINRQAARHQRKEANSNILPPSDSQNQNDNCVPEDNFRYFKDNIICYRCRQVGHYKSVCPEITGCLFCLSKGHSSDTCPQRNVCYRCYGFGHIIGECPMENPQSRCFRCDRNHAGQCYFLTKGKQRTKKMFKLDNLYNDPNIRCRRCKKLGHLECGGSSFVYGE